MKRCERRNKKAQRVAIPIRLCVVCVVMALALWLSISFCLFTLTIKWTGKNAIEVIKDYIRSCELMEYIGL